MENIFGKRLRELREEHELTMDYVVFDMQHKYNIEINKGQLSRWEKGQSPSLKYIKYLAVYYNVSADYLLGLTESKKPSTRVNSLRDILMEEHSTNINIEEARKIIDNAINKEPKKLIKVGMPQIAKQPKPKKA